MALHVERRDRVAIVTLDDAERRNALSRDMVDELTGAVDALGADDGIGALVVTGTPPAFCSGADVTALTRLGETGEDPHDVRDIYAGFLRVLECPLPTIAAVNGAAVGAGLNLALACDIRIAAEDAQLGLTEVNLAIIPGGGGTQRLPRLVGRGKALEMILTGARVDAREALRIGLVERVVPTAEVLTAALGLARTLAERAPVALRYAKEAVVKGLALPLEDGLRLEADLSTLLRTTEDRVEGAKAFLEKRKPRFTGQ